MLRLGAVPFFHMLFLSSRISWKILAHLPNLHLDTQKFYNLQECEIQIMYQ